MIDSSGQNLRRSKRPLPLGGIIGQVVRSLGLSRNYDGWTVVSRWPEIVGAGIAAKAPAIRFDGGTLFVEAADASWRQQLSLQSEQLLEKIHSYPFGRAVTDIRFVAGRKGMS